jgi:hypothetical protein
VQDVLVDSRGNLFATNWSLSNQLYRFTRREHHFLSSTLNRILTSFSLVVAYERRSKCYRSLGAQSPSRSSRYRVRRDRRNARRSRCRLQLSLGRQWRRDQSRVLRNFRSERRFHENGKEELYGSPERRFELDRQVRKLGRNRLVAVRFRFRYR